MAAAVALMLTACSSENDVVQSATQQEAPKTVGFDVYTQNVTNVTRATAGRTGAMTTTTLKESSANGGGFGVFAYHTDNADYVPASSELNFMYNELVLWNETNQGWYYNPLKYWPNETSKDSQSTPAYSQTAPGTTTDKLTFFAYAPYVNTAGTVGITQIPAKNNVGDPHINYKADMTTLDANDQVDLLWGVAPSGGLTYTQVNGSPKTVEEGLPLVDMVKPNVNTNMKFLFKHALARLGITAVAAVDQVSPGGKLDPNTKITIKEIELSGLFGETGILNLNNSNHANVANWISINGHTIGTSDATSALTTKTMTIPNSQIALHVADQGAQVQTNVGVTTTKSNVIAPSTKYTSKVKNPIYTPSKKYSQSGVEKHASYTPTTDVYTYDFATKAYTKHASATPINTPNYPAAPEILYTVAKDGGHTNDNPCPDLNADYYTESSGVYTKASPSSWNAGSNDGKTYYILTRTEVPDVTYTYASGDYDIADNNFYMLVPTNNVKNISSTIAADNDELKALRTITVKITYYVTTLDPKLNAGYSRVENIIEKKVVFPSLENGKSYNLNLVLGLTSVKMEAEVADWDVVNVNADLPQKTAE